MIPTQAPDKIPAPTLAHAYPVYTPIYAGSATAPAVSAMETKCPVFIDAGILPWSHLPPQTCTPGFIALTVPYLSLSEIPANIAHPGLIPNLPLSELPPHILSTHP